MKNDPKVRLIRFPEYEVEFLERYDPVLNLYDYYFMSPMTSYGYHFAFGVQRRFTKQELRNVWLAYEPTDMTEEQWKEFFFEDQEEH